MLLKHALEKAAGLKEMQLVVDTCTTAEVMIELYNSTTWEYCLVIVDENLSGAGGQLLGSEGVKLLVDSGCDSKFVFSSANCSEDDRARYQAAGATAVWPKPYPPIEEMTSNVRTLLQVEESPRNRKVLIVEDDQMK